MRACVRARVRVFAGFMRALLNAFYLVCFAFLHMGFATHPPIAAQYGMNTGTVLSKCPQLKHDQNCSIIHTLTAKYCTLTAMLRNIIASIHANFLAILTVH